MLKISSRESVEQFRAALAQALTASSKDRARPLLSAVNVSSTDGESVSVTATDSYVLVTVDVAGDDVAIPSKSVVEADGGITIDRAGVAELVKFLKAHKPSEVMFRYSCGSGVVVVEAGSAMMTVPTVGGDVAYPDWRHLVSKARADIEGRDCPPDVVAFGSVTLERLAKVQKLADVPARIRMGSSNLKPALAEIGDATVLMMPVRIH